MKKRAIPLIHIETAMSKDLWTNHEFNNRHDKIIKKGDEHCLSHSEAEVKETCEKLS